MKRYRRQPADESGEPLGPPGGVMPWRIQRLSDRGERSLDAAVVIEEPLEIRLAGRPVAVLMRTPGLEKELAAGFVLGEGLVAGMSDIALVRHCGQALPAAAAGQGSSPGAWPAGPDAAGQGSGPDGHTSDSDHDPLDDSRNRVDVTLLPGAAPPDPPGAATPPDLPGGAQLIRSGCGRAGVEPLVEDLPPVRSGVRIALEVLPPMLGQITRQQAAYRAAGGIHAAAVFDLDGRPLVVCEDIGRHNAVDKAAGYCLLRGIPLDDKVLVSTGRASYDMVAKGARLGIPILASISSPTSLAVELAEALNCTLLGYLRGKTLNIYAHGWRILRPL